MRPALLTINLNHLRWNYKTLQRHMPEAKIMAVVKANAYGLGLIPIATTLLQQGCRQFAVTDAVEGAQLRLHLTHLVSDSNETCDIIVLSGVFDPEGALLCKNNHLTPTITSSEELDLLENEAFQGQVWLKLDTGMNRLGAANAEDMIQRIQTSPDIHLTGIMSHLACADEPSHPLNQQQITAFQTIQHNTQVPNYSLLNSAGIVAFHTSVNTNVIRPGIALYGIEPIPQQPLGLKPIAELSGQIIQIHVVKKGESVSYSATWVAPKDMKIAVVNLGYADGLPRLLSNQGRVWHKSGSLPVVGRVCMDYCMLAVESDQVHVGDKIVLFGGKENHPKVEHVATQCQTISYEIFTGLGSRLSHIYIGETDE